MIERKLVKNNIKEFLIQETVANNLSRVGHSHTQLQRTPLGEKIIIHASRPGFIVGRKGSNIKKFTQILKKKFDLDNPQIEIAEVQNQNLDANIIAEKITNSLERFGTQRFKGIGHKVMSEVMGAGARGVEILISGKVPSARAKRWRFYQGYLKKAGDIATTGVRHAYATAKLKTGTIGIQVRIMPPDIRMPDQITFIEQKATVVEEKPLTEEQAEKEVKEIEKKAKETKKRPRKKKDVQESAEEREGEE